MHARMRLGKMPFSVQASLGTEKAGGSTSRDSHGEDMLFQGSSCAAASVLVMWVLNSRSYRPAALFISSLAGACELAVRTRPVFELHLNT